MAGINDIDKSVQNLIKMTNAKVTITKLWENASSKSAFANQTISVNLSGYDLIIIIGNTDTSSNTRLVPPVITKIGLGGIYVNSGGSRRYFKVYSDKVEFDAVYPSSAIGDSIPLFVYGIKLSGGGYGLRRIFSALRRFLGTLQGGVCYGN